MGALRAYQILVGIRYNAQALDAFITSGRQSDTMTVEPSSCCLTKKIIVSSGKSPSQRNTLVETKLEESSKPPRHSEDVSFSVRNSACVLFMNKWKTQDGGTMLRQAINFLIAAFVAFLFGFALFGGVAYSAAEICFFIFLVLFVLALVKGRRASV